MRSSVSGSWVTGAGPGGRLALLLRKGWGVVLRAGALGGGGRGPGRSDRGEELVPNPTPGFTEAK